MIRNMKDGGMSNREIAEELGISRNTERKMLNASTVNEHSHRRKTSKLDPYRDRIRDMIDKHNLSAITGSLRKSENKGMMADTPSLRITVPR